MKKFFAVFFIFIFSLLLPFAVFFTYIETLPPQFTNTIMGTLGYKFDLLEQSDEARVIFAGGSSAAYGVNCEELEKALGRPCIDVGVVYGLGAEFYCSLLTNELNEGDVVVFAPEYGMWNYQLGYNLVWCCCENNPKLIKKVPPKYWLQLFSGPFLTYAKEKLAINNAGSCDGSPFAQLGERGDMVIPRVNIMEELHLPEDPVIISTELISDETVNALNRLQRYCERVGATLIVTYPPVNRLAVASGKDERADFESEITRRLNADVVGDIEDSLFDENLFYDTNYHLNTLGASERSKLLATLIEPYLLSDNRMEE